MTRSQRPDLPARFSIMLEVTPAMSRHFSDQEIEEAGKVLFFRSLGFAEQDDDMEPAPGTDWDMAWTRDSLGDLRMLIVGNIVDIYHPEGEASAKTEG